MQLAINRSLIQPTLFAFMTLWWYLMVYFFLIIYECFWNLPLLLIFVSCLWLLRSFFLIWFWWASNLSSSSEVYIKHAKFSLIFFVACSILLGMLAGLLYFIFIISLFILNWIIVLLIIVLLPLMPSAFWSRSNPRLWILVKGLFLLLLAFILSLVFNLLSVENCWQWKLFFIPISFMPPLYGFYWP